MGPKEVAALKEKKESEELWHLQRKAKIPQEQGHLLQKRNDDAVRMAQLHERNLPIRNEGRLYFS